jgi:hypothetical protein
MSCMPGKAGSSALLLTLIFSTLQREAGAASVCIVHLISAADILG